MANESCSIGKHWVSAYYRKAYIRFDGVFVKAAKVKAHCRENPKGYKKWHQKLLNRRPRVWKYYGEKSKKWTAEDSERLLEAMSVLPEPLISHKKVKLYRMGKSNFKYNPATSNYDDIVVYDYAFKHKDSLAQILSHELSHSLFLNLSQKDKREFSLSAQWKSKDKKGEYLPTNGKIFLQEDSRVSVAEDFANHLEYYLFRSKDLQKKSPDAFLWIKNKFGKKFKVKGL